MKKSAGKLGCWPEWNEDSIGGIGNNMHTHKQWWLYAAHNMQYANQSNSSLAVYIMWFNKIEPTHVNLYKLNVKCWWKNHNLKKKSHL